MKTWSAQPCQIRRKGVYYSLSSTRSLIPKTRVGGPRTGGDMIGRVVKGKYKIYDEVGAGGFATVYLGRNLETNEIVAIKILSQQFTRESRYVERFRREAALAERLQHPNIVRILDHGIENGMHFLVMEFVEGLTLDTIIERQGKLSVEQVVAYTKQICAGLEAAYRAGVVHRDIKPANIMITPDGTVKIMDFGIARMESMVGLTQSGMFMGTPRYISPEMARGAGADIRSDLYAVGLLMYEMLTGAPPFDAENPWAVLRQQIESEAPPVRKVRPDVPQWLEAIISRAIAKNPARRFQTPGEMLAALRERTPKPHYTPDAAPTMLGAATPPSAVAARPAKGRPKGLIIGLVAAALLVAAGLAAALIWGLSGGPEATPTPTQALVWATTALPTLLPTNTPVVLVVTSTPSPTPIPTEAPPTEPPTATLPPTVTPTEPPPTEPPTDTPEPTPTPKPTAKPTKGPTKTPKPTATPTSPPAPAVTGKIVYTVGGVLHIVNAATGQDIASTISGMRQPNMRADGVEILADGLNNPASVVQIDAATGTIIREQTRFTDDYHPFWSPDGTRFVFDSLHHGLGDFTMLYTQGLTNAKPQPEVTLGYSGQQIRGHSPVWMQDDYIAFTGCDYWPGGTGGSKCGIYRIPSWGESRPVLIHPGSTDMRATDSYGNQLLIMSQEEGNWEVYLLPASGGAVTNLSQNPANDGLGTFSPDGKMVAFVSNRGGGWAVWMVRVNGSGLTKLFDLPGKPTDPWYMDSMSWGP
ncbi:MAG TPA: serine/threonine-protein kinase [Anaerolineae bacterium]|nr:serine/threonine-protein kinase [Anaerolineae bacterium]